MGNNLVSCSTTVCVCVCVCVCVQGVQRFVPRGSSGESWQYVGESGDVRVYVICVPLFAQFVYTIVVETLSHWLMFWSRL